MKRYYKQLLGHYDRLRLETRWGRVVYGALDKYGLDGCGFMAAGLSFYAMLSLIPLAWVFVWLITKLVKQADYLDKLNEAAQYYLLPHVAEDVSSRIADIHVADMMVRTGTLVGVVFFVWAGVRFYETLQFIMARAWDGKRPVSFFKRKLLTVAAFFGAGGLLGVTILAVTVTTELIPRYAEFFGIELGRFQYYSAHAISFAVAITMVYLIYRFMTGSLISKRVALATAIPVGVIWELTKRIFTSILVTGKPWQTFMELPTNIPTQIAEHSFYHIVYGPFASFILLMIWVYTSSSILLLGAEFGAAWLKEFRPDKIEEQSAIPTSS